MIIHAYTSEYYSVINKFTRNEEWVKDFETLFLNVRLPDDKQEYTLFFAFFYQTVDILQNIFDETDEDDYITMNIKKGDIKSILGCKDYNLETYKCLIKIIPKIIKAYSFWRFVIQSYNKELFNILNGAPQTTEKFIVWRGVKDDEFIKDIVDDIYTNTHILSCTLDITTHENFRNCMKCIIIPPKTRCFYAEYCTKKVGEHEILFSPNANFIVDMPIFETISYRPFSKTSIMYPTSALCDITTEKVKIMRMKFISYS